MERFWKIRVELVFTLKEGGTSSSLATFVLKPKQAEGVVVMDVEGSFSGEPKDYAPVSTSANMWSPSLPFSRYAHTTQAALASLGAPPDFDLLQEFQLYLNEEYGGFHRDQM